MTQPDRKTLALLVDAIVETVSPLRVVLFGSAARGDMRSDSDIDLLVVVPRGTHRRHTAQAIYAGVFQRHPRLRVAFDVLVATQDDLARHGSNPWLVYRSALQDGKTLYDSDAA